LASLISLPSLDIFLTISPLRIPSRNLLSLLGHTRSLV
jgi:hypothetical protein